MTQKIRLFVSVACIAVACFTACKEEEKPKEKDIVKIPEQLNAKVTENLQQFINYANANEGKVNDTFIIKNIGPVSQVYSNGRYQPIWSSNEKWTPLADSLFSYIKNSKKSGLFPSDYYFKSLKAIREAVSKDSMSSRNAVLWSKADLMFTDGLMKIARDLKYGRIERDSVTLRKDSLSGDEFYMQAFNDAKNSSNISEYFAGLEPKLAAYDSLKLALANFVDSVEFKQLTYLPYLRNDSAGFYKLLQVRLTELGIIDSAVQILDTTAWKDAITKYQKAKNIKVTGKVNDFLVNNLNNTEWERFKRAAITLDRFKQLPDTLPLDYAWVNIPAFMLRIYSDDTLSFESRVIVGSTKTRTPLLTSSLSNFITYPQWTVPYSIIFKEMLPQIQKDVNYLAKQNLMIVDKNDSIIDPALVDWSKMNKNRFPYLIKQRQGDDNSLGVLKFNFPNRYAVYLHDTNARWMFGNADRALSHGCVRVKDFQKLAFHLIRNDSIRYPPDSIRAWIGRQEKHVVSGFARLPLYIRYFTCEAVNGKIRFYADIYAEDKTLRDRHFANKQISDNL